MVTWAPGAWRSSSIHTRHRSYIHIPSSQCSGSVTFWIRILIIESVPLTNGFGPDPALFVSDLQDANKKYFFFLLVFMLITF
jgi:hypothetical protein